jgi:predicted RND superfamily exporter protein
MASAFLVMPPMLLAFDKGRGAFAASPQETAKNQTPSDRKSPAKAILAATVIVIACIGATRLSWEEDLRRFRQAGNPALSLQEDLAKVLSLRLQPLAVQIPLDDDLPQRWNAVANTLKEEGFRLPHWASMDKGLASSILDRGWRPNVLRLAEAEGLDPSTLEPLLTTLQASIADPLNASRSLSALLDPKSEDRAGLDGEKPILTLPVRLSDDAQDRLAPTLESNGARLIGTRPLFRALKTTARHSMQEVIVVAMVCILGVAALFGRRWIFLGMALAPMVAGQAGVLGTLGWSGEPLTFLSLIAIPVTLGVSIDTVFNLLNRARHETDAPAKVSRVNAVCAGTTLAGFGGLAFSSYKALQGLGIAAIGGTAVALLTTQWLLPWLMGRKGKGREQNGRRRRSSPICTDGKVHSR